MELFTRYALVGSLVAGAAGVLTLVRVKHGIRRHLEQGDEDAETPPRRIARAVRLADAGAVLCFAMSVALGVAGLLQHTRSSVDGRLQERLDALEERLTIAEAQLEAGAATVVQIAPWEPRVARIERRLGTMESAQLARSPKPVAAVVPSTSPRAAPGTNQPNRNAAALRTDADLPSTAPDAPVVAAPAAALTTASASMASPAIVPAHSSVAAAPPTSPEEDTAPRTPPAAREPTLAERAASGWDSLKRDLARGGDEWMEGWRRLRRLFRD